jgi:hypothetical protein
LIEIDQISEMKKLLFRDQLFANGRLVGEKITSHCVGEVRAVVEVNPITFQAHKTNLEFVDSGNGFGLWTRISVDLAPIC